MRRSRLVLTTTHVDSHNERLAPEALPGMVADIKSSFMPLWYDHDPRIPPTGRLVDAHIEEREDGELAVVGFAEEFERGDVLPFDGTRLMKIASAPDTLRLEFDRSYRDDASQALIADIAAILGTPPQVEAKKAVEPVSVLTLAAQAVLGGIVGAVSKTVTDEIWQKLKKKIALALARRRDKGREYIFQFRFVIIVGGREVEADLLATSPTDAQVDLIFKHHLAEADAMLLTWLPSRPEIRRVVFDAGGRNLKFSYALRSDVVAVFEGPGPGA